MSRQSTIDAAIAALRSFGLRYPGVHLKSPWPGHKDLAVNDKTFAYLPTEGSPFSISCKLPTSSHVALMLPFTEPTPYGLGKSGWVTATPPPGEAIPVEMFKQWIDESYRAQAPRRLIQQLAADGAAAEVRARAKRGTRATTKQAAPRRATAKGAKPKRIAAKKATTKGAAPKRRR